MGRIAEEEQLKKEKKKKRKNRVLIALFVIGILIAVFIPILGIIIALIPLILNAIIDARDDILKGEEDLDKKIKEELAPKIIETVLPNAKYLPYEGIEKEIYNMSEFDNMIYKYDSTDKLEIDANINKNIACKLEIAEVKMNKEEKDKTPYLCIFGYSDLSKDIRSKIKISKEGTYEQGSIFKVNTDYKEFEEIFDTMSPNQILAKKIITENIQKQFVSIYNNFNKLPEIHIIKDKVYVKVETEAIIKNTEDGKKIDRMILEKHYNLLRPLVELMISICNIVNKTEI